jgi:SulP family sulfate permease
VREDGGIDEVDPPDEVPAHDVVVLQPYGSLFFATAPILEEQLPTVTEDSGGSVVILRFRGKPDIGSTLIDVLETYSVSLDQVGSKLMIVTDSDRIINQLDRTGAIEQIGDENVYRGGTRLLGTVIQASSDAQDWVTTQLGRDDTPIEETPIDDLTMGDLPTDARLAIPGADKQAHQAEDAADSEDEETSDSDET